MAHPTEFRMLQKATFFRRIQVVLIGVIAVSVLEQSAKRDERLQADALRSVKDHRANQRIAKTSQRKATAQFVTAPQAQSPQAQSPQAQSSIALKTSKPLIKSDQVNLSRSKQEF
jgi:hypothetical protein